MEAADLRFSSRVETPRGVMRRVLRGESVILNLNSARYHGLDLVGTRMWDVLTQSPSIEEAFRRLSGEYDVEEERLRGDLRKFVTDLVDRGLLVLVDA